MEENILKKANQKRLLGDIAIEGGNFTTAHFKKSTIRDLFDVNEEGGEGVAENDGNDDAVGPDVGSKKKINFFETALAAVEETTDVEVRSSVTRFGEISPLWEKFTSHWQICYSLFFI